MKKILIFEDDAGLIGALTIRLGDLVDYQIIFVSQISEAREAFLKHSEALIISCDGRLIGSKDDTEMVALVKEMRNSSYSGIIIAASADKSSCEKMMAVGADINLAGNKSKLASTIEEIVSRP